MTEMLEVHLVNAGAPALLAGRLKDLMRNSPSPVRHVINVASAEGQFSSAGNRGIHPHTNMAKAALNMLTRTIAQDFITAGIYVNSVDPGWVSDQFPRANAAERAAAITDLPLDTIDAAARICDPIFTAAAGESIGTGQLLKDYEVADW